jgi:hypothetical protein
MAAKSENKEKQPASEQSTKQSKSGKEKAVKSSDINTLIKLLQDDLTSHEPEAAIKMIEEWQDALSNQEEKPFKDLVKSLKNLKKQLENNHAKEAKIADILQHLGEQTQEAASYVEDKVGKQLVKLAKALSEAANSITDHENGENKSKEKSEGKAAKQKSDSTPELPDMDALASILKDDLIAIESEEAIVCVKEWQAFLQASKDDDLKAIAKDLKRLEKLLKDDAETSEFSELLEQMGEGVMELEIDAADDIYSQLQAIGTSLIAAADALEAGESDLMDEDSLTEDEEA